MIEITKQPQEIPIFESKSYVICYGLHHSELVNRYCDDLGLLCRATDQVHELNYLLENVASIVGFISFNESLAASTEKIIQTRSLIIKTINPNDENIGEVIDQTLLRFIHLQILPGLDSIAVKSCDFVFSHFIPIPVKFHVTFHPKKKYTHKVVFESITPETHLRLTLRFSMLEALENVERLRGMHQRKVLDVFREFGNQLMGVLSHNFSQKGIHVRVGTPTTGTIEVDDIHSVQFLPSLELVDIKEYLHISIGLKQSAGAGQIDLRTLTFSTPSQDVDFF